MKKIKIILPIIIVLIVLLIGIKIVDIVRTKNQSIIDSLEYDILVEEHLYEYEGVDPELVPAGGYSTNYNYTFINTAKKEKYLITYQDVWDVHNERGDKDIIIIKIEKIDGDEIKSAIKEYHKTKLSKVKTILDKHIKEEYEISKVYDITKTR